jgi:hypothetical protein
MFNNFYLCSFIFLTDLFKPGFLMRILFITTEDPFPPRNGITIPVYNYIKLLAGTHKIDLLIVNNNTVNEDSNSFVSNTFQLKYSKPWSIFSELFKRRGKFEIDIANNILEANFGDKHYSHIIASPISVVSIARDIATLIEDKGHERPLLISAISDSYRAVLNNKADFGGFKDTFNTISSKLRSYWMGRVEANILRDSSCVYVQSSVDKAWIDATLKNEDRVKILTNGVDDSLFSISPSFDQQEKINILFVASMSSSFYQAKLLWFYYNVWPKLKRDKFRLIIKGRGLPKHEKRFENLIKDPLISYEDEFIDNISDVYSEGHVLIAPIFKSYGFINKVGEALASGLIVVGDITAYNAINGIEHNKNCFVANNKVEFIKILNQIESNISNFAHISIEGKKLAIKSLKWENKEII